MQPSKRQADHYHPPDLNPTRLQYFLTGRLRSIRSPSCIASRKAFLNENTGDWSILVRR